uniref:Uncharacterized protein n=1 Tax=Arundo donax TaxID=35708 RepID=A0A0A9B4U2_ARUDO
MVTVRAGGELNGLGVWGFLIFGEN